jgi:hypothetical protein
MKHEPKTRAEKFANLRAAEEQGIIADDMKYRLALMERVHNGDITLEEAQKELRKVKRNAKKNGKLTRNQAFNGKGL